MAPIDAVRAILTKTGDERAATLGCGLEEVFSQSSGFLKRLPDGAKGMLCVPVREGGAAEKAGLTSETLITHIDGVEVTFRRDFMSTFRKLPSGKEVTLRILTPGNHEPRDIKLLTDIIQRVSKP